MQPFHRILFDLGDRKLEIEWEGGEEGPDVEPPNRDFLVSCTEERRLDTFGHAGIPPICWRADEDKLFEPLQLRENTEYLIDATLPIDMADAEAAWRVDNAWPLTTVRNAYKSDPPKRWRRSAAGVTITGRLNFRSYVGGVELALPDAPAVAVEVACTKIGYFEDFPALLNAIADEYATLLLEVGAPTFARFSASDATDPQLMTFLFLLRHAMDDSRLPAAVESIIASPCSTLVQNEWTVPTGMQREPLRADFMARIPEGHLAPGGPLASLFRGHTPTLVPETIKRETFDTPENRYVKAFLENLRDEADSLRVKLLEREKVVVAHQVGVWSERISDWLQNRLWHDVRRMTHFPSNSQILQKATAYREVLATDFRIQLGMDLPWNAGTSLESDVRGDLRPISQLYEYWCFFFLRSVLRNACGPEVPGGGTLIRTVEGGLSVVLRRGVESRVVFRYQDAEGRASRISLFYNKKFVRLPAGSEAWDGSYSAIFNPDFSVMIDVVADDMDRVHWLHFDAKYRLDVETWVSEVSDDPEDDGPEHPTTSDEEARIISTYKRSDLFKMHTYRDAVLGSRGSYILFPGSEDAQEIFVRYPGIEYTEDGQQIPSVGAFQANPRHSHAQSQRIEAFLIACIERLVAADGYQEEIGITPP